MSEARIVWCVLCVEPGQSEVTHIFSTPEAATAFCEKDARAHVVYDYALDCPERMEGVSH